MVCPRDFKATSSKVKVKYLVLELLDVCLINLDLNLQISLNRQLLLILRKLQVMDQGQIITANHSNFKNHHLFCLQAK